MDRLQRSWEMSEVLVLTPAVSLRVSALVNEPDRRRCRPWVVRRP